MHPVVFQRHIVPMKEGGVEKIGKPLVDLSANELKEIEEKATQRAKEAPTGEYMTCMFLLLADNERYVLLKISRTALFDGETPDIQAADDGLCPGNWGDKAPEQAKGATGRGLYRDKGTRVARLLCP